MKRQVVYIDAGALLSERLSGIGHLTLYMVKGLLARDDLKADYEIRLLAPAAKAHLLDQWQLGDVKVVRLPLLARIWNAWPRVPFAPPIDLFLGKGTYVFTNFKRWPLLFSKSITYIHDISFELFPQFTEPRNLAMLQANVPRWIDKSTLVVTDSESSRQEIIEHFKVPPEKIHAIYCGIDNEQFGHASQEQIREVKQKYGITKPYVFFLSNLEPRKNIVRLIQAFKQLPQEYKERYALLMVGGMSWQNGEILTEVEKATQEGWTIIKPTVYVPDVDIPALLAGAEALVHPALHEGFGIPVVEAMASGTPVLASDIPVLREVAGDAALFANPTDVSDITVKMQTILTDQAMRTRLIAAGKKRSAKFTWDIATDELVRYIRGINEKQ